MSVENIEYKRKRLIFRSWHRGTKEMDLILGRFADAHISGFSEDELNQYEEILNHSDPDLYNWVGGQEAVPENIKTPVLERLVASGFIE